MKKIYQKMNDSALRPILMDIVNAAESNGVDIFNVDYVSGNIGEVSDVVDGEIESLFGPPANEDTTFFIAVLLMNKNFMTDPIKRPKMKSYRVFHVYQKVVTLQETYENNFDSYLPITKNMLEDLQTMGYYNPAEGDLIDDDVVDTEYTDEWVDGIEEI